MTARVLLLLAAATIPAGLILLPLAAFLVTSFYRVQDGSIVADPTLSNYAALISDGSYVRGFGRTLWLCAKVTALGLAFAYPVAWFAWRCPPRARYAVLLLMALPLFMSYIVKIYTMRAILGLDGLLNHLLMAAGVISAPSLLFLYNQTAVLLTMTVLVLPFMILPIFLSLERIPRSFTAASADLGAGPGATFMRVVLPLSAPGAIAGGLFAFVLALGDFITPQMVGGPSGFTFGRVIWSQFGLAFNWPFGAALATLLLVVASLIIAAASWLSSRRAVV